MKKIGYLFLLCSSILLGGNGLFSQSNGKLSLATDSLQLFINQESIIAEQFEKFSSDIDRKKRELQSIDSIKWENIFAGYADSIIYFDLKDVLLKLNWNQTTLNNILGAVNQLQDSLIEYRSRLLNIRSNILKVIESISGSGIIKVNNIAYRFFITDPKLHTVKFNWKNANDKNFSSIGNVLAEYNNRKNKVLMMTNGGMYTPNHAPEGLYIENKKMLEKIDTLTKENLNFYLKPNGVFWIDTLNNPHIDTTEAFQVKLKKTPKLVLNATQSGPMAVIKGKIHRKFKKGSNNLNIRSGVGVLNNRMIFIISNSKCNFYDFASVFLNYFGCKDALYLDGAISLMYLSDISPNETGGDFGPIISVIEK
jgi:uncharacterized protein YigE (DUF2233 family)